LHAVFARSLTQSAVFVFVGKKKKTTNLIKKFMQWKKNQEKFVKKEKVITTKKEEKKCLSWHSLYPSRSCALT